jgi:hypothetical protein
MMMQQWLGLFIKVTKPVLTTLVYTGINSWLEAFQEEIKERQKQQASRVLDSLSVNEAIANQKKVALKTRKSLARGESQKHPELWPLRLSAQQLLNNSGCTRSTPLRIFLAPPKKQLPEFSPLDLATADIEQRVSQVLREFLQKNYSLHAPLKATEFLGGLWNNNNFHEEASIKSLFEVLKSLPTIILQTEIEGNQIAFKLAYWGKHSRNYSYETIFKFNYQSFLEESVKARVLKWKELRARLLTLEKSTADIQRLGGNCELNLALIEELETLQAAGIETEQLNFSYQFDSQDFEALCQFLSICHCLVAGWVADIHYLVNDDIPPHLPVWLPPLGEAMSQGYAFQQADSQSQQAIFRATVSLYQDVLTVLGNESSQNIPELALKLAESLIHLPDSACAIAQLEYSFECWCQQRQLPWPETAETLESIRPFLSQKDWAYLSQLKRCLSAFRDEERVTPLRKLIEDFSPQAPQAITPLHLESGHFQLHHTVTTIAEKVFCLSIQPNGHQLIGQREYNTLKLWHFESGKGHLYPTHELTGHSGKILAVHLSADGQFLASSDNTNERSYIKIWHLPTGKLRRTLFGHKQPIQALAIYPGKGAFLASGSHKIKLWELHTGESWLTLFGHKETVYCLAISPDGQTLISGSKDRTIRIWDLKTGHLCRTLKGHHSSVRNLLLSADGQTLISGSEDKTIKLWEVKTGKLLRTLTGHSGGVQALTLCPQSQQLFSGCEAGTINVWDLQTGNCRQTLLGHQSPVRTLAFSPDGQVLASGCEAGKLQFWKSS